MNFDARLTFVLNIQAWPERKQTGKGWFNLVNKSQEIWNVL